MIMRSMALKIGARISCMLGVIKDGALRLFMK